MAVSKAGVDERATDIANVTDVIQETPKRRWVSYIWDTFDKSPEERRLLTKLDAAILSFASLGESVDPIIQCRSNNPRLLHQIPRPGEHQQCIRLRNVCIPIGCTSSS